MFIYFSAKERKKRSAIFSEEDLGKLFLVSKRDNLSINWSVVFSKLFVNIKDQNLMKSRAPRM